MVPTISSSFRQGLGFGYSSVKSAMIMIHIIWRKLEERKDIVPKECAAWCTGHKHIGHSRSASLWRTESKHHSVKSYPDRFTGEIHRRAEGESAGKFGLRSGTRHRVSEYVLESISSHTREDNKEEAHTE